MSSAERWRAVAVLSRISRIFSRGSVTFKPALRRSLPSTGVSRGQPRMRLRRFVIRYYAPVSLADRLTVDSMSQCTRVRPARLESLESFLFAPDGPGAPGHRHPALRVRVPHEHPAGKLSRRPDGRPAHGWDDPRPGALSARHSYGSGGLR